MNAVFLTMSFEKSEKISKNLTKKSSFTKSFPLRSLLKADQI